ncbi:MAG: hypothetical protein KatS3mg097_170 [Candidatus Parcubacteria bacterium]|nr:MAG: hypothetical protein KatS3mg097_170 [Candidatus Parcubacteria bacterium]
MITSEEIRKLFCDFFSKRGHKIIPSSSLIPTNDPSVLLTTAGMQQFKNYFVQKQDPLADFGSFRVSSIQKCFRTTDIDEIGDERHLTFFEMLGNFSFGPVVNDDPNDFSNKGYFKQAAITWAFDFIHRELKLPIDYVTVFEGDSDIPFDNESYDIWRKIGFDDQQIKKAGRDDNFWGPTGEEGPCGPTTEIYIDNIEVWNLVFNEYYQHRNKKFEKLKMPGVDTGMGLERLVKVIQKAPTVFDTDLFSSLKSILAEYFDLDNNIKRARIVMDHIRSSVFLIGDGLYPSNLERGYILRRILRRLTLNLKFLHFPLNDVEKLIKAVLDKYNNIYSELKNFDKIKSVIYNEMTSFEKTLTTGLRQFNKIIKGNEDEVALGEKIFYLYTSYGLPLDIAKDLLSDLKISWTENSQAIFNNLFDKHKLISKGNE